MSKSFAQFLWEDAAADVAKLQADIANTDIAIQQRTSGLVAQRQRLQKMLAIKMKQKESEDKKNGQQQKQQQEQPAGTPALPGQT